MQECEESQTYASFSSAERAKVAEHATCATSAKRVEVPLRNMPNRLTVANSALTMHATLGVLSVRRLLRMLIVLQVRREPRFL